jgi:hypothetical protein
VKEAIRRGLAENRSLKSSLTETRKNLVEACKLVNLLKNKLSEVNLFNAKVLHVNRIFNKQGTMTKEQRSVVLESIDNASSVSEVKKIYETITKSFNANKSLSESRKSHVSKIDIRATKTSSPNRKVLRESVDRDSASPMLARWATLAGLKR